LKLPLYARAGIAEVWLVDIPAGRVEVYRDPSPTGYGSSFSAGRDESLSPLAFPELSLAVAGLLG
jgi:Uma2 family endonuclease